MKTEEIFSTVGIMAGLIIGTLGARAAGAEGFWVFGIAIACAALMAFIADQIHKQMYPERRCPTCGIKLGNKDANFCPKCGQPLPPGFDLSQQNKF